MGDCREGAGGPLLRAALAQPNTVDCDLVSDTFLSVRRAAVIITRNRHGHIETAGFAFVKSSRRVGLGHVFCALMFA